MLKPWLWLPSQLAHDIGPLALKALTTFYSVPPTSWNEKEWRGLKFKNPLGIAGGVDKNAAALSSWWKLGLGFAEVGTVTPKAQGPNPGKIMARDISRNALWNKMGFPNGGANALKANLQKLEPYKTPVFVNIGKNRDTDNDRAHEDYIHCLRELSDLANAFVINISSPNTKDLRALQNKESLDHLLREIQGANEAKKPLLLKLSPDVAEAELSDVIECSLKNDIDGWILTNTTTHRPEGIGFPDVGGLSGQPLSEISKSILERFVSLIGKDKGDRLVISAGGIMSEKDIQERLEIGADLLQFYSALVFEGPFFFRNVLKKLEKKT